MIKRIFKEQLASDDEDFDDVYEYMMDEQDHQCYKWEYSQIKGGYETDWHADEDCITLQEESRLIMSKLRSKKKVQNRRIEALEKRVQDLVTV